LITGFFQNWIVHTQQGLILKTDANGNELWRKKINKISPNVQDGKSIVQDSASKKIAIVGYQYINGTNNYDNLLILDSLGTKITNGDLLIGGFMDTIQGVWNRPNNQPGNVFTRLTIVDKNGQIKWNRYYDYKVNSITQANGQGIHSINICQDGSWLAAIEGYN